MSNFKKLLIPAIILAVLVGAYLIVTNLPEPEEDSSDTAEEKIQIFDFAKDDLKEIKIESKEGLMHFQYVTIQVEQEKTNDDGEKVTELVDRNVWQAIEPEGMRVKSSSIDSLAWNANTLKAVKLIEENPSDLSVYGLDNPTILTFIMKDGTEYILHVGNETPTGGAYYAMKWNEEPVYTIGEYEGEKFTQSRLDLIETKLYDKEYTVDDFSAISFTRKGERLFDSKQVEKGKWWLSYPIDAEARFENIYTIAEALAGITASKYIEDNAEDLGKYGLANPSYVFEYTVDGIDYKLSFGNKDEKAFYAVLNEGDLVFTVSESNFTFLDKPIEEIVNSFIHLQNINEVSELIISFDGRTDIAKINVDTEDDENSTYEFNGTLLTEANDSNYVSTFKKYYQGAIGLTVDKIDLEAQPKLVNPDVTIQFTLKTGEKIKVDLVSTPDQVYFYAFKNGQYTGMKVRQKQLESETMNGLRISRKKLDEALAEREEKMKGE